MIVNKTLNIETKLQALEEISKIAQENDIVENYRLYLKGLMIRESQYTTAVGNGIAIPHCKEESVKKLAIIICRLKKSIKWESIDNQNIDFIIAIAVPRENENTKYLYIISRLARKLMDEEFVKELKCLESEDEITKKIESIIT